MVNKIEQLIEQIKESQKKIADLFIKQCQDGKQSKDLLQHSALACGQFLNVLDKTQRGTHGTASALLTINNYLGQEGSTNSLLQQLTNYLVNRESIEGQLQPNRGERVKSDLENVIKISEIIIALSGLDSSIQKGKLCDQLVKKLEDNIINGQGWGFFLGDDEINLLPTAFAMNALYLQNCKKISNAVKKFIKSELLSKYKKDNYKSQVFIDKNIDVFCLYSLTFLESPNNPNSDFGLTKIFKKIWNLNNRFIESGIEQNVEYYWMHKESCYVRIPVDLYMIALASYYDFKSAFSSSITQNRLKYIVNVILNGGFYYPYSGKMISSRTNAILYEVLSIIKNNIVNKKIYFPQAVKEEICKGWHSLFMSIALVVFLILWLLYIFFILYFYTQGRSYNLTTFAGLSIAGFLFGETVKRFKKSD